MGQLLEGLGEEPVSACGRNKVVHMDVMDVIDAHP
jgi:hypothetical protein